MKQKNALVMFVFAGAIGAVIAAVIWGFMRLVNLAIGFLWGTLPGFFGGDGAMAVYTIVLCTFGGILIGWMQKHFGPCPDELPTVMAKLKKEGTYDYHHLPKMLAAAALPLLFGGAIGPEAGLTGVIVGLCCWAGDNFKFAGKTLPEMADVGIAATLSVLFGSPFFGFVMPVEEDIYADKEIRLPKGAKIFATFCAIFAGLGCCMLLGHLFGKGTGLPRFGAVNVGKTDLFWMLPAVIIGVLYGLLFKASEALLKKAAKPLGEKRFLLAVIGGVLLGIVGAFCPLAMFSGETQMETLIEEYALYTPAVLFLIAAVKMVLINVCLQSGWRGGNFFPAIFAGVCAGFAVSMVLPVDPVFSCAVVAAAVMTTVMRKPFAVAMLLMLCFPVDCLLYLIAAAFLAALIPDFIGGKQDEIV